MNTKIDKDEFIKICNKSKTKQEAYQKLGIHRNTFERYLNIFNYTFKSINPGIKYDMDDILNGKYPNYPTSKLNKRLIKEGYKERKCECCGLDTWLGKPIILELHHIDGNHQNNSLENLILLCPNCHSMTDNYKSKKLKNTEG